MRRQAEIRTFRTVVRLEDSGQTHVVLVPTRRLSERIYTVERQVPLGLMPSRPLNVVGPQLRRLRSQRGLSQPQLAAECQRKGWDIGRDTIANIEGQRRWVADFELLLLARVLKTNVGSLLPAPGQATRALKALMP